MFDVVQDSRDRIGRDGDIYPRAEHPNELRMTDVIRFTVRQVEAKGHKRLCVEQLLEFFRSHTALLLHARVVGKQFSICQLLYRFLLRVSQLNYRP